MKKFIIQSQITKNFVKREIQRLLIMLNGINKDRGE